MPLNSVGGSGGLYWQEITDPQIEVTLCLIRPVPRPQTALPLEAAALAKSTLLEILGSSGA
jgi:hypothetical protein